MHRTSLPSPLGVEGAPPGPHPRACTCLRPSHRSSLKRNPRPPTANPRPIRPTVHHDPYPRPPSTCSDGPLTNHAWMAPRLIPNTPRHTLACAVSVPHARRPPGSSLHPRHAPACPACTMPMPHAGLPLTTLHGLPTRPGPHLCARRPHSRHTKQVAFFIWRSPPNHLPQNALWVLLRGVL